MRSASSAIGEDAASPGAASQLKTSSHTRNYCRFWHEIFSLRTGVSACLITTQRFAGLSAGICTSAPYYRTAEALRHKKAEDISLFYLVILLIDLGLWIRYGFPREDNLVVVTNGFALVINGIIIVAGIRYQWNNHPTRD